MCKIEVLACTLLKLFLFKTNLGIDFDVIIKIIFVQCIYGRISLNNLSRQNHRIGFWTLGIKILDTSAGIDYKKERASLTMVGCPILITIINKIYIKNLLSHKKILGKKFVKLYHICNHLNKKKNNASSTYTIYINCCLKIFLAFRN